MALEELVRELAKARKDAAEAKAVVGQRRRELDDTEEYHRLTDAMAVYDQAQDVAGNLDTAVREAAVATGEKRPHPAVEVKTYTVVAIEDELRVIQWASQAAPNTLKLDKRAIEKAAKAVEIPGVKLSEERRASIDSDLSKYA